MALIPGAVEADWLGPLDLLYSHTLFLGDVLPRSSAVAIWMDRLVAFEVCPSCCSDFLLLISSQSKVIQSVGLGDLPEEQLNDWFAARGIRRAEIQARIGPFATASWVERFPHYAAALGPELDLYESVVGVALRLQGGSRSSLSEEAQMHAFNSAGEVISSQHARGLFPSHLHEQFWYRLSLERLAASGPRFTFEPYALPLLDSPAYAGRAPRPSLGEVAPRSTGGFDDVALTYVHGSLGSLLASSAVILLGPLLRLPTTPVPAFCVAAVFFPAFRWSMYLPPFQSWRRWCRCFVVTAGGALVVVHAVAAASSVAVILHPVARDR
jgi:hypothetical protein